MIATLLLLLTTVVHAGVVRAPVGVSRPSYFAAAPAPIPALPSYLSVAAPSDAVRLAAVIHAAQASPTAVAVLAQVERFAAARGRPVIVEIAKIKDGGTYSLDSGILSLRRRDLEHDAPRANVALIIHELQHLLQTKHDIPSDLLEAEVEAYVVDFRVVRELNDVAKPGSNDARIQAKFKKGFEPFMSYLGKRYSEDAPLHKTKSRDYENRLRRGLDRSTAKLGRLNGEREERVLVLDQMRRLGHSQFELKNYRRDEIAPIEAKIETVRRQIGWSRKDIALLADPGRRAKARAYARAVIRRARAFQKIFAHD